MGSAVTRKNGYQAVLRWHDTLGKEHNRARVTTTRREAAAALAEFRRERDAMPADAQPKTLGAPLGPRGGQGLLWSQIPPKGSTHRLPASSPLFTGLAWTSRPCASSNRYARS